MEKMKLQVKILLSYSVVFPDRHDKTEDLLANVPSKSAVEFVASIISWKNQQLITQQETEIWMPWLLQCRSDVKDPIGHYMDGANPMDYVLLDRYAMLSLLDKLLSHYNDEARKLNINDYSNLLLSYLICCDERIEFEKQQLNNDMPAKEFVKLFLPKTLKYNNIEADRDYRLQLILCYSLLMEFPKVNNKFHEYVDAFCKGINLNNPKEYLDHLFMFNFDLMGAKQGSCVMEIDESDRRSINYIEHFTLDAHNYTHTEDFHEFREYPVLKTGSHRYVFLFTKLFLDKAFTGLLFDMANVLENQGVLKPKKAYADLKGFLGENFSEKYLFYTIIKRCFGRNYVRYTGTDLKTQIGDGEPDYYMRRGNRVFVFECKDTLLANKYKLSGDYEEIVKGIEEKYISNENLDPKGITQLATVIENKLSQVLSDIDKAAPRGTKFVFPILVYFDDSFDIEGVNWYLNNRFKEIVSHKNISSDYVVKDLVMINIEMLMRLENFFADDKLKLATLINSYIDFKSRDEINQVFPFNKFLFQEAKKKGYELKKTKWFDEVYQNLVAMDKKQE
ncbi:MAG: hypothetical protein J6Y78_07550 [Paludibacteraceae bacterium]|nr:hypothetical protein [Paludibacteraceae bacterium]